MYSFIAIFLLKNSFFCQSIPESIYSYLVNLYNWISIPKVMETVALAFSSYKPKIWLQYKHSQQIWTS